VKTDASGAILDAGNTCMGTRTASLKLQLALYSLDPEVGCIIHVLTSSALAVSLDAML